MGNSKIYTRKVFKFNMGLKHMVKHLLVNRLTTTNNNLTKEYQEHKVNPTHHVFKSKYDKLMDLILSNTKACIHTTNNVLKYEFIGHVSDPVTLYDEILKDLTFNKRSLKDQIKQILKDEITSENIFDYTNEHKIINEVMQDRRPQ